MSWDEGKEFVVYCSDVDIEVGGCCPFRSQSGFVKLVGKSGKTTNIRALTFMTTFQMEDVEISPSASVSIVPSPTVRRPFENSDDNLMPLMRVLIFVWSFNV